MSQPMTAKHKRMISILIPAYNEEAALPLLHDRLAGVIDTLEEYAFEILVVNDGSSDSTPEVLRQLREQSKGMLCEPVPQLWKGNGYDLRHGLCPGRRADHYGRRSAASSGKDTGNDSLLGMRL